MSARALPVCFCCPVQNVVNHRLRWAHPRACGENKKRHKCHVCSENLLKMTLQLVHFEPSQPPAFEIQSILLTIQHHCDSLNIRPFNLTEARIQTGTFICHQFGERKRRSFSEGFRHYLTLYHALQPDLLDWPAESSRNILTSTQSKRIE